MSRQTFLIKFLFGLALLLSPGSLLKAQEYQLLAKNEASSQAYLFDKGAIVRLLFSGYGKQVQEFKGTIDSISRDSVYLYDQQVLHKKYFTVAIADITGFRAYSTGIFVAKPLTQLGLIAGYFVFYYGWVAPLSLHPVGAAALSLGFGIGSYYLVKALFPDKVVRTREKGWVFLSVEKKSRSRG